MGGSGRGRSAVTGVSLAVGVGLVCALLSALGTNLSFLFKQRGAVAAPDVEMRHPLRSAIDLFRSKWWSIGWGVAGVAFALHVVALTLAPISIGQAVLAGGLVFLAVLAERFFGFELGRRQWIGIGLVAVSLSLLTLTGGGRGGAHSGYSLAGMIIFEGIAFCLCLPLVFSHRLERIRAQRGVLLGIAAGLGFGISDVAIKALSGDLNSGPVGLLSPWSVVILTAAVGSFFASARSLQIGDGVAVIAVTSVAANLSTILAGLAVFGDRLGNNTLVVGVRIAAFALILVGAALIPAPVRSGEALEESTAEPQSPNRDSSDPSFRRCGYARSCELPHCAVIDDDCRGHLGRSLDRGGRESACSDVSGPADPRRLPTQRQRRDLPEDA